MRNCIRFDWALVAILVFVAQPAVGDAAEEPPRRDGNCVIRGPTGDSEIVITTTSRVAGAIHSITWNGREFIDSYDHGRQMQSAANFDAGSALANETFNPTEAGSLGDGTGDTSTSRLLHQVAGGSWMQTTTQMAFWLAPGERSGANVAKNKSSLSNHLLTKRVRIGYEKLPHAISYDVAFAVPLGERHKRAVFEVLTAYLPPDFGSFWKYDPASDGLERLTDGPGEQPFPVVMATEDGQFAMGCYTPEKSKAGVREIAYGRFRFDTEKVVKWNIVARMSPKENVIAAGDYHFRCFVVVGDLKTVTSSLGVLHRTVR